MLEILYRVQLELNLFFFEFHAANGKGRGRILTRSGANLRLCEAWQKKYKKSNFQKVRHKQPYCKNNATKLYYGIELPPEQNVAPAVQKNLLKHMGI